MRIELCPVRLGGADVALIASPPHERTLTKVISSAGGGLWQTASISVWGEDALRRVEIGLPVVPAHGDIDNSRGQALVGRLGSSRNQ